MSLRHRVVNRPSYQWGETNREVVLNVDIADAREADTTFLLMPDGMLKLSTTDSQGHSYEMCWELRHRVRVEDSTCAVHPREIKLTIAKLADEKWTKLQREGVKKPPQERVNWDMFCDSSGESEEEKEKAGIPSPVFVRDGKIPTAMSALLKGTKRRPDPFPSTALLARLDVWDGLLSLVALLHIALAPYTKVEESFNIQATHDLLFHNVHLNMYDHFEFPGVVPRTFLGPLVLVLGSWPVAVMVQLASLPRTVCLVAVRLLLAGLNILALSFFRRQVSLKFGAPTGIAFYIILMSQFHLAFYFGRTLPNTFALCLVVVAFGYWFQERYVPCLGLLTFAATVFRSELVALIGPIALEALVRRRATFWTVFRTGLLTGLGSLCVSVFVDSIFWGRLLWPEGVVLYYNTIQNQSHLWGVSPFHWYFTAALPRALMGSLLFIPIALHYDRRIWPFIRPILTFVSLYSCLPHKELRFIFYAIPMLDVVAALGLVRLFNNRKRGRLGYMGFWAAKILLVVSVIVTGGLLYVSSHNYPGGHALQKLHALEANATDPYVHIDVEAAQTGVSRFLQRPLPWQYSKEEDLSPEILPTRFTHLVTGKGTVPGFRVLYAEKGFTRTGFRFRIEPKIYLHKREGTEEEEEKEEEKKKRKNEE